MAHRLPYLPSTYVTGQTRGLSLLTKMAEHGPLRLSYE